MQLIKLFFVPDSLGILAVCSKDSRRPKLRAAVLFIRSCRLEWHKQIYFILAICLPWWPAYHSELCQEQFVVFYINVAFLYIYFHSQIIFKPHLLSGIKTLLSQFFCLKRWAYITILLFYALLLLPINCDPLVCFSSSRLCCVLPHCVALWWAFVFSILSYHCSNKLTPQVRSAVN